MNVYRAFQRQTGCSQKIFLSRQMFLRQPGSIRKRRAKKSLTPTATLTRMMKLKEAKRRDPE